VPQPTPPPLPPETRTVGQLVAETIRLYGERFWRALPLGLPLATTFQFMIGHRFSYQIVVLWLAAPFLAAAYVAAAVLASGADVDRSTLARAVAVGTVVFLPAPMLLALYLLPAAAWLALVGLAVPVAVIERRGFVDSIRRAIELSRADYVHALGSLATLTIVFVLTALVLGVLLRGQADVAVRIAGFLAVTLISPLLVLGPALLYYDQEARSRIGRGEPVPRR
jgi:hypothetical protein